MKKDMVWCNIVIKEEPAASPLLIECAKVCGFDGPYSRESDTAIRAFYIEPAFALAGSCPFTFDPYKDHTFSVMIACALRMSAVAHDKGVTVTLGEEIGFTSLYGPHSGPAQAPRCHAFAVMTCAELHYNKTQGIGPLQTTRIYRLDKNGKRV